MTSAVVNSDTHQEVAIKKIGNAFDNIIDSKRTMRKIKLLSHMDHENVSMVTFMITRIFSYMILEMHLGHDIVPKPSIVIV